MKNKHIVWYGSFLVAMLVATSIASCNKKFDEPPLDTTPDITANTTIKQLRGLSTGYGVFNQITTDIIVSGTVVGNDKSGNIYKEIYLQDSTAGIAVQLDATGLYNSYPLGREVFIMCKGLYIANESGMLKLCVRAVNNGTASVSGIPSGIIDNYVKRGKINAPLTPKVVMVSQLNNDFQSMLIQLDNYEVTQIFLNNTYADTSANKATQNIDVQNCSGTSSKIAVRTSGYSNFAGVKVPQGNGAIIAIYTVFASNASFNTNPTKQLILRDTSDMRLYGVRCNGSSGGSAVYKPISDIRAMYAGTNIILDNYILRGVVISDAVNGKNIASGNMFIQDGDKGIDLHFVNSTSVAGFSVGDSIQVNVAGGTLTKFNGLLEISLAATALPTSKLATGKTVTPKTLTIAQIVSGIDNYEGSLVRVANTTPTAAGTYSGNNTISDASGSLTLYTISSASFATTALTKDCKNFVGIPSRFNTVTQLLVRDVTDVTAASGCSVVTPPSGSGINLTSSPLVFDFNNIETALPTGVSVYLGASSTSLGTTGIFTASKGLWSATGAGFKNFATYTASVAVADQTAQDAITNRALGLRQTSAAGYDPGASFVFQIANTTSKTNLAISFLLQSLDNTAVGRISTWTVDYATGDAPTSFTPITTNPATLTTAYGTFASTAVTANFGAALNNVSGKVWIRISTFVATTGSSNRASTGIDDVKFTWQ